MAATAPAASTTVAIAVTSSAQFGIARSSPGRRHDAPDGSEPLALVALVGRVLELGTRGLEQLAWHDRPEVAQGVGVLDDVRDLVGIVGPVRSVVAHGYLASSTRVPNVPVLGGPETAVGRCIQPWLGCDLMAQAPTDVPAIPDYQRLLDGKVAVVTGGGDGI